MLEGFGGVSEYGITVRWDKNFLTLIHLTLARREKLRIYGGIRFGGALPLEEAWAYGIDHVAIAAGAGRPTIIDIKNNLIRGIRKASDFLMALQLTGAFKNEALSNLQVRLPAVVIGGGLTGVDTATELMAYYPLQVEKTLDRYEALVREIGEVAVRGHDGSRGAEHPRRVPAARAEVRAERVRAAAAGVAPDLIALIRAVGRRLARVSQADAGRPRLSPEPRRSDARRSKRVSDSPRTSIRSRPSPMTSATFVRWCFTRRDADGVAERIDLPARTVLVAAGTVPNVTYEKEHRGTLQAGRRQKFFQGFRAVKGREGTFVLEPDANGFFTSYENDGRFVSYYGDNHPRYNGNVVKAMASAKDGYPHVVRLFEDEIAALDPAAQPQREASVAGAGRHVWTISSSRRSSGWSA